MREKPLLESRPESVTRRDFLNTSILVTGGAMVSLGVVGCAAKVGGSQTAEAPSEPNGPKHRLVLADAPELQKVGGVKQVKAEGFDFFVVREGDKKYVALNNVCTHEACPMKYKETTGQIVCPCHQSIFDLNGQVVRGPAQKSLAQFPVKVESDALLISLTTE